jgi:hypothetical protein
MARLYFFCLGHGPAISWYATRFSFVAIQGEAIRAINSALQDPLRQITDETIAAVQALAAIEVSFRQHLIFLGSL